MADGSMSCVRKGALGGFVGGGVFGIMMAAMGMLPMIGNMVGQPSALVGLVVHMMMSVGIGAAFGLMVAPLGSESWLLPLGLAYGLLWWVIGPLTVMPVMMGGAVAWNAAAIMAALPSGMGHLVFGGVMAVVYRRTLA